MSFPKIAFIGARSTVFMRGLRTVPHLWSVCEDMLAVCPDAILLQHVNPMAINAWAISARHPAIRQVGLCHSVQGTAMELANDLDIPFGQIRYRAAGINHMAFYLEFEQRQSDGSYRNLYPNSSTAIARAGCQSPSPDALPQQGAIRDAFAARLFRHRKLRAFRGIHALVHQARGREDLIEKFGIPLDEYPKRCVEQIEGWKRLAETYRSEQKIEVRKSREYASSIVNSVWTGEPSVIYGNQRNDGSISSLPHDCAVEVACLVDASGIHPTRVGALPPQLTALIRTNDGAISATLLSTRKASPGRAGLGHEISLPPPMIPAARGTLSTSSFMVIAAVCHPLAASPAKIVLLAAASSRWNGCGSN